MKSLVVFFISMVYISMIFGAKGSPIIEILKQDPPKPDSTDLGKNELLKPDSFIPANATSQPLSPLNLTIYGGTLSTGKTVPPSGTQGTATPLPDSATSGTGRYTPRRTSPTGKNFEFSTDQPLSTAKPKPKKPVKKLEQVIF